MCYKKTCNLILDLSYLSNLCYKSDDTLVSLYTYERPYNKDDISCVFNRLTEFPSLFHSEEDCDMMMCDHESGYSVITFRGTSSTADVLTDLKCSRVELPIPISKNLKQPLVHSGFFDQFFSIKERIDEFLSTRENRPIIFCGHSLGGGIATIASLYYTYKYKNVSCVTFGSPRVGDKRFAMYFNRRVNTSVRFVNRNDPIPCIPSTWRFRHVRGVLWIRKSTIENKISAWRFYRFVKNTALHLIGLGYNACKDHACDHYIDDLRMIFKKYPRKNVLGKKVSDFCD
jgi:hypothetical protein